MSDVTVEIRVEVPPRLSPICKNQFANLNLEETKKLSLPTF